MPIPDEVLREIERGAYNLDGLPSSKTFDPMLIDTMGQSLGTTVASLARELLALREAARRVGWTAYGVGMRAGGAGKTRLLDLGEQLQALFALLPPLPSPTDGALLPEEPK